MSLSAQVTTLRGESYRRNNLVSYAPFAPQRFPRRVYIVLGLALVVAVLGMVIAGRV